MKAAIYIRVSTEEQAREGYSIETQKNKLIQYCQINDYDIVGIYIDDGVSAKDLKRSEVQRLLNDIKNKNNMIDTIVVYKLDRITRKVRDLLDLIDLFEKQNITFTSLTENIDTSTATGRMFVQLLGVFAEWERGITAERVEAVMEHRAVKEGKYTTAVTPLGYDNINGDYIINESEAFVIRMIFEMYQSGKASFVIAKRLNNLGYKTKKHNKPYTPMRIRRLVRHECYCGYFRHRKHVKNKKSILVKATNIPTPIISRNIFLEVNKILNARSASSAKKYAKDIFVFHSKLKCSCGQLFRTRTTTTNKNALHYYRCGTEYPNKCFQKCIRVEKMEQKFIIFLKNYAKKNIKIELVKSDEKIKQLKKEQQICYDNLAQQFDRKKRLQHLFLDNKIDNNSYLDLLSEIDLLIKKINNEIRKRENETNKLMSIYDVEKEKKVAGTIVNKWSELTLQEKKEFVKKFIKEILIDKSEIKRIDFII